MTERCLAFIDESGHEQAADLDWLILACVVFRESDLSTISTLQGSVNRLRNTPEDQPLHFQQMAVDLRVRACKLLSELPVRAAAVLFHKPSKPIETAEEDPTRIYRYGSKILLERISWACEDFARETKLSPAQVFFSERRGFPYKQVLEYFRFCKKYPDKAKCRANWKYVDPDAIEAKPMRAHFGLQLADLVASALGAALEEKESRWRITDDRPIRALRPIFLEKRRLSPTRGVVVTTEFRGLRFWPELSQLGRLIERDSFEWFHSYFN